MLSFAHFQPEDGIPIYQQILLHVKRGIVAGVVQNGDEMPSRRVLSALLGVNPNTIQKAYRMLEEEALMTSHAGAKSVIVLDEARAQAVRAELLACDARGAVRAFRSAGLTLSESQALLAQYWDDAQTQPNPKDVV